MEEETVARYLREYSEIEGLQHATQLSYTLTKQNGKLYMTVGAVSLLLTGLQEDFAARLLQFLYENAVTPENFCGVVQDICGTLAKEEK